MKICVCGWYYNREFLKILSSVSARYIPTVVCHKNFNPDDSDGLSGIAFVNRENIGLEFGAYDYYIKNIWNGEDVLFLHDDTTIASAGFFDKVADAFSLGVDQAFIFHDEAHGKANQHFHGRAMICSARFIRCMLDFVCECNQSKDYRDRHNNHFCNKACAMQYQAENKIDVFDGILCEYDKNFQHKRCMQCKKICDDLHIETELKGCGPHTGIWYDVNNKGHISGCPPVGVRHYNDAIYHLALFVSRARSRGVDGVKYRSNEKIYLPEILTGKRGVINV